MTLFTIIIAKGSSFRFTTLYWFSFHSNRLHSPLFSRSSPLFSGYYIQPRWLFVVAWNAKMKFLKSYISHADWFPCPLVLFFYLMAFQMDLVHNVVQQHLVFRPFFVGMHYFPVCKNFEASAFFRVVVTTALCATTLWAPNISCIISTVLKDSS